MVRTLFVGILLLLLAGWRAFTSSNVRHFEGNINLVRETAFDTTYISIRVSGPMIRVDEYDSRRQPLSRHIVDVAQERVIALCHSRRMYAQLPVAPPANAHGAVTITKSGNHREIHGHRCYQWRVRDPRTNTEVAFWVTPKPFAHFDDLLRLLNRTDSSLSLFKAIPNNQGVFPMLTETRTLHRRPRYQIAVVEIQPARQCPSLFAVPQGYSALDLH